MSQLKDLSLHSYQKTKLCLPFMVIFLCSCQSTLPERTDAPTNPRGSFGERKTNVSSGNSTTSVSKIPCEWVKPREECEGNTQVERQQTQWKTQIALGNEAAQRKQWRTAAGFYNQALDLMDSETYAASKTEVKRIYRLANHAELIANILGQAELSHKKSMGDCGSMRSQVRGIQLTQHVKSVHFEFGQTKFTVTGEQEAYQLATCLKQQFNDFSTIKFIGHTDEKWPTEYNCNLSINRANALRDYLQRQGVTAHIITEGRGENEPMYWNNPEPFTKPEIDAFNRRVEIVTLRSGDFSKNQDCRQ